jgi:hypothetical protein
MSDSRIPALAEIISADIFSSDVVVVTGAMPLPLAIQLSALRLS